MPKDGDRAGRTRDEEGLTIEDVYAIVREAFDKTGVKTTGKADARLLLLGYETGCASSEAQEGLVKTAAEAHAHAVACGCHRPAVPLCSPCSRLVMLALAGFTSEP